MKVNIGGLPFLPSATEMVREMLDAIISYTPDSAFRKEILSNDDEEEYQDIDWNRRDVLVVSVDSIDQFYDCKANRHYYIPVSRVPKSGSSYNHIALIQPKNPYGTEACIDCYGKVTSVCTIKGSDAPNVQVGPEDEVYCFDIDEWKSLGKKIEDISFASIPISTNSVLLKRSKTMAELYIKSEEEYLFNLEMQRLGKIISLNHHNCIEYIGADEITSVQNDEIVIMDKQGRTRKKVIMDKIPKEIESGYGLVRLKYLTRYRDSIREILDGGTG